ncbi:MAG: hypothetical protein HYV34_04640 [Candidatus Kerfeldbacteria bacterium]|nr:hypothetical protein [Candidatus Kerfeldbacteria bacterium]
MIEILPSILEPTIERVHEKIQMLEGLVTTAHIDVMDGVFVPSKTDFLPGDLVHLDTSLALELHLMVAEPEKVAANWGRDSHVSRVLVHAEAVHDIDTIADKIHAMNKQVGVVVNIGTSLSALGEVIPHSQAVQFMGIHRVGFGGEHFEESILPVIRELRRASRVLISVDGGINAKTAQMCVKVGATRLVVGSYLFNASSKKEMRTRIDTLERLDQEKEQ